MPQLGDQTGDILIRLMSQVQAADLLNMDCRYLLISFLPQRVLDCTGRSPGFYRCGFGRAPGNNVRRQDVYRCHLHLTDEGRSRFFQWSSAHENENLVFILKHRVVAAGRIKQKMDVSSWEIGPLHDEETARALANYVSGIKR